MRFTEWDNSESPPVRRDKQGNIEINAKYPLFTSRRYGEVFKKILITVFLLSEETKSSASLYSALSKELVKEFEDIVS